MQESEGEGEKERDARVRKGYNIVVLAALTRNQ